MEGQPEKFVIFGSDFKLCPTDLRYECKRTVFLSTNFQHWDQPKVGKVGWTESWKSLNHLNMNHFSLNETSNFLLDSLGSHHFGDLNDLPSEGSFADPGAFEAHFGGAFWRWCLKILRKIWYIFLKQKLYIHTIYTICIVTRLPFSVLKSLWWNLRC